MTAFAAARQAAAQFAWAGARLELQPLGRGLINDTYLVSEGNARWVLQRLNRLVFPDPPAVMGNIRRVTEHARRVRMGCPGSPWRLPEVILARSGVDLHWDEQGECWRAMTYLDHTHSLPSISGPEQAEQVGRALGWFHGLVGGLPADVFHDTLPDFHVTPRYLAGFDQVVAALADHPDPEGLGEALNFVESRRAAAAVLETAREQGRLLPRVIHGDPKLDNVLFDSHSGQAVSLIDLDTVKPGLLHYDLGDCFRSCCNLAGEGSHPAEVRFDLGIFQAILQGYQREAGHCLSGDDRDCLFEAIRLLPFELGLRFLTDHLAGNVYFKVREPGQNLAKARVQFELVRSIECQERDIRRALASLP